MATKFASACWRFFGKRSTDQKSEDFLKEVRQLTPQDQVDLIPELERELGENIEAVIEAGGSDAAESPER